VLIVMIGAAVALVPVATPSAAACGPVFTAPLPDQPWPLRRLRPDLVWPLTEGAGVTVAVIDSGVSDDHPALAGQVLAGQDLVAGGSAKCDSVGHGTIIAGIIAGRPTASSGFHGMAPQARILPLRVLDSADRSFDQALPKRIAQAIRIATDRGASIINLSLTTVPVPELADAVSYAIAHDVVVVAAAGNDGSSQSGQPDYPAAYPGVLAVAGIDENGNHVQTSSSGDYVDIAAPGLQIAGPAPQGGGYALEPSGGTSFAAAYVSGVAALVRAYWPGLRGPQVVQRILRTADHPANGWDRDVGAGVVNPYWAVVSVSSEDDDQGPPGRVALPAPRPATSRDIRPVAAWTAVIAVAAAGLVLLGMWVVRRGHRRQWRPGLPDIEP
jgi:type VII secretion-associated serine protease mycosin